MSSEPKIGSLLLLSLFLFGCASARPVKTVEPPASSRAFSFEDVSDLARREAQSPYQEVAKITEPLVKLDYDQWRDIRYRPEKAIWKDEGLPFQLQLFHPGFLYNKPVKINVIGPSGTHPIPFANDLFDHGKTLVDGEVPANLGFAGFRVHTLLNTQDYFDEAVVFLGASYFRAVAKGQQYGLSARALAIDTASSSGEEFPMFKEFWVVKPGPKDSSLTVFALLDSPSVTGAYRFVLRPGKETVMEVQARLWPRKEIEKLGIAPATSMFLFGENGDPSNIGMRDFRPEVHDSDGLLIHLNDGEWLWRPLVNLDKLFMNTFQTQRLQGFGLLQRDTDFDHYQDLESRYDRRPSLWMEPRPVPEDKGLWQNGRVELVQIPTQKETTDNIVSYWVPGRKIIGDEPVFFAYSLRWFTAPGGLPTLGQTQATRLGNVLAKNGLLQFVLDFEGSELNGLDPSETLEPEVHSSLPEHAPMDVRIYKNPVTQGWRLAFQMEPPGKKDTVAELRASIKKDSQPLTETWSYAAQP